MLMIFIYILSFIVSFNTLPKEIKNKLEKEFSGYSRVEFEILKAPKNTIKVSFNETDDINIIGNIAYVPVLAVDKRGRRKRTTISVKVKLFDKVYVSMKDIKKWEPINAGNFELVEKDISSVRGKIVASLGEVIGKRAGRNIRKGDILTSESLDKMPIIFPGDKVLAASIVGHVQISFNAISKQEGCVGDIIRIRTSNNDVYKAEIIDEKNVLIVE